MNKNSQKKRPDLPGPRIRRGRANGDDIDDERTNAVGLFNAARSYRRSAEHVDAANLKVSHPRAPVTFLFCDAIELYLKPYVRRSGSSIGSKTSVIVLLIWRKPRKRLPQPGSEQVDILSHRRHRRGDRSQVHRYRIQATSPNEAFSTWLSSWINPFARP